MNLPLPPRETLRAAPLPAAARARGVTAVLGPTNTGKTHLAIERMLTHSSGAIGLPLRLLAREVYNRLVEKAGVERVALVTGEEKIKPPHPAYWVATMEAMPRELDVAFVALDEIQLSADLDRGHVFTDRLLNRRGREETLLLGAETMAPALEQLIPGVNIVTRPRLSKLTFAGSKKLSRLPARSAIVAFSQEEVYAIAELLRRQRGGAAVVLGALSPRTRNAQVELFQNGDVDYIVATDAIGMGLNLDVSHVAFAGDRKFDGWHYRRLNPAEFGQIAGRAGRHVRDGTFGTTGRCPPFDEELAGLLEEHRFDPVSMLQWRNSALDYASIESLQASLDHLPDEPRLTRAPLAGDVLILDIAAHDAEVRKAVKTRADVERLWNACQIPDYRKVSPTAHAELALTIFGFVVRAGRIPDTWFAQHLSQHDRTDGDIDTLSNRIAQVRTFTYLANRPDWLREPEHWQGVARQVEDNLSDALHERLTQRFVDRRTSVLMRRLRENAMLEAEVTTAGDVVVEGQHVGQLQGFRFTPDPQAEGAEAKALNAAAQKALAGEIEARAERVRNAVDEAFLLSNEGVVRWLGDPVARLVKGESVLKPRAQVLANEHLTGPALELVQARLELWLAQHVKKLLGPLLSLEAGEGLEGMARGIAFQAAEALGVLERGRVANDLKNLGQDARGALRKLGLRFGAYHVFVPALLKPAPRSLAVQLWTLAHDSGEAGAGAEAPQMAGSGRTSFVADKGVSAALYRVAGYRVCGERAVRVDILERLADLIRPAIHYRPGVTPGEPPPGTADSDGFMVTPAMVSLTGSSGEGFASVLRALNYVMDSRKGPAITVPLRPMSAVEPTKPFEALAETAPAEDAGGVVRLVADPDEPELPFAAPVEAEAAPTAAVEEPKAEAPVAEAAAVVEAAAPAAEGEAPAAAPVEEAPMIEVWRPHRHNAHARPKPEHRRPRRDDRRPQAAAAADGAPVPAGEARPEGERPPRHDRPRHGERRRDGMAKHFGGPHPEGALTEGQTASAEAGGPRRDERPRRDDRRGGERNFGNRPQGDRPRGDRPFGDGPPRRDGGRPGPRHERGPSFASTEAPKSRDRAPDPDSPFAKLAALKASLEAQGKKP